MSYSPSLGRWLQQDPIGYAAGTMNLYQMEGNSPVNQTDPSGLATVEELKGEIDRRFGTPDLGKIEKILKTRRDFLAEIIRDLKTVPPKCQEAAKKLIKDLESESRVINTAIDALINLRRNNFPRQVPPLALVPEALGIGSAALTAVIVDAYEKIKVASDPTLLRTNNIAIKQFPAECKCKPIEEFKTPPGVVRERVEIYPIYDQPPPPPTKKKP